MNQVIYQDPQNNAIRASNYKKLETDCPFGGLGIKMVGSGEEVYFLNHRRYSVKAGDYMIGNSFTRSVVQINSQEQVNGLCIDLSPDLIRGGCGRFGADPINPKRLFVIGSIVCESLFCSQYHFRKITSTNSSSNAFLGFEE